MNDSRWGWRVSHKTLGFVLLLLSLAFVSGEGARAATPSQLRFSDPPRDAEFLRTGLFAQPLVPIGATTEDENRDFSRAIATYDQARRQGAESDALASLAGFAAAHPKSAWRPSLLLDLGAVYRETGHFSKALETWQAAWDATKNLTDSNGRALGDASIAALSQFEAYLGRKELLAPLLEEAKHRAMHGTAAELVSESARGLADMNDTPETAFRCGPMALKRILQSTEPPGSLRTSMESLDRAPSTPRGISLASVRSSRPPPACRIKWHFATWGRRSFSPPSCIGG
ncbi:MAG: tetratricopeptide repeat protein [Polyangiaceae bacterium]